MKPELDEKLCQDFPNLYRERHGSANNTSMCWGFDIQDGWYDLLYEVSAKLEALILQLPEEERKEYCAAQVKEKFGALRLYLESGTKEMYELVRAAETKSANVCEECGQLGVRRSGGWIKTRCDDCHRKEQLGKQVGIANMLAKKREQAK